LKSPVILRIFKGTQLVEIKQFETPQIIFGNGGEVQVQLSDSSVSPVHCLIEMRDAGYYLCDLGSSTGTYKNKNIALDEPLNSGDQIGVGAYTIHFFVGVPKPKEPPVPQKKDELKTVKANVPPPPPIQGAAVKSAPSAKSKTSSGHSKKSKKTFAPPSEIQDLKSYLRPTKGPTIEVITAWRERILNSYHFTSKKKITIGSAASADIQVPNHIVKGKSLFIETSAGTRVSLNGAMKPEIVTTEKTLDSDVLVSLGKAAKGGGGTMVRVDQSELLAIQADDGNFQIFVRHIPTSKSPILAGLDLTAGELTAILVSMVIVSLLALYMSVYGPSATPEEKKEEQLRLAQFVFNKKEPPPETKKKETLPPPPKKVTPPPQPVKVEVAEKKDSKGDPKKPVAIKDKPAAKAAEVRAIPENKNKPKKFTSAIQQGGATKSTDKEGANAQSNRDVTKTGLLSAFNTGGSREKLTKAYSGSGELLGEAEKATGTSGQSTNRAGGDIGGKFKDTGAGGKGTATQGIAGIGTKGRSSGQSEYGELGSGGKGSTAIEVGGTGAEFIGTVDREAVRRVVRSIYNQIKNCYERYLRVDSEIEGKIVIHWEVVEQGKVKVSKPKEAPKELTGVAECVAGRIRDQKFPDPPQGSYYEVDYPFMMGKQK